jgi:hypothetical protein
MVMRSDFGAAHTAKERLRVISASLAVAVALGMIDALSQEAIMQRVPS